ncbi:MAG TPA: SRPBCC domain-containing protein [Thermoplasmata archaeon]|nr:SRPBCC domain-containing protein [Thermoplasmata archaeon]
MHVEGTFETAAPIDRVYALFRDPVAFTDCLDDPHAIHPTDADHFEGTITTGVAFIRGTFRVRGNYGPGAPNQSLTAHLSGTGMGSGLDADFAIQFAAANGKTQVGWKGDLTLTGTAATLGERMVRGTVEKKSTALFENARRKLEGPA